MDWVKTLPVRILVKVSYGTVILNQKSKWPQLMFDDTIGKYIPIKLYSF